jgi:hypothetical protein
MKLKQVRIKVLKIIFLTLIMLTTNACSLIFGGSQKVDHKSHSYKILKLDKISQDWKPIKSQEKNNNPEFSSAYDQEPDQADYAYENVKTRAIISLNSACSVERNFSLEEKTKSLIMGLPDAQQINQKMITLDGVEALDTLTVLSIQEKNPIHIRTVVLKKSRCTYDFMMIAKAKVFDETNNIFNQFLKDFHAD